ncbi:MAG TPA: thioredoxin family protein, partial [Rhodospirillales bacterium]
CIPYTATVALTLPTGAIRLSQFAHLIDRFQANVPAADGRHGLAIISAESMEAGADTVLRVSVTADAPFKSPDLFVEGPPGLSFSKPAVKIGAGARTATLETKVFGLKDLTDPPAQSLDGRPLTFTLVDGDRAAERRLAVRASAALPTGRHGEQSLALILALAVLGGLILNLMPCVLPVLSIKVLGVVGHGGGAARTVRLSFVVSALGILSTFAMLAAALIGLKAAGMTIGWGIQFQQPWFLIAMTLLVVAFACNLWGFLEVRLPGFIADWGERSSHVHGLGGHFLQGALATLLATPCSAPFLGTAIGFALARGAGEIMAVFLALGLGLALPFLAIAAVPTLATWLPRPGAWMVTLRRILGLALAGTGIWLLSVLAVSAGMAAAVIVGIFAATGAAFLYFAHAWPGDPRKRPPGGLALVALVAFLVPGWLSETTAARTPEVGVVAAAGREADLGRLWVGLDENAIPALVAQGKTVFVDVTAEWCLTCKVNKVLVLSRDAVVAALSARNVVAMQGDWTRPDPAISTFLARHQRYGIPFNAVFGPGAPEGVLLPELLTERMVLDAIGRAAGTGGASASKSG